MRPILFDLFGFSVSSFWTMAFLGFVVAFFVMRKALERRGYDGRIAYDVTLWAYIGGWVGARLFVIPTGWEYFVESPVLFLLSGSGWVWYGGVIGGAVAVTWWARRNGLAILAIADMAAPALAIGLGIGRIGCHLSGDGDYGIPTDLPWAMAFPNGVVPTDVPVHPVPLYEMTTCFALAAYLWRIAPTSRPPGTQLGIYLIVTGVVRFLLESVRRNPAWLIGLTTAQWMSIGSLAIGWYMIRSVHGKWPAPEQFNAIGPPAKTKDPAEPFF